MNRVAKLPPSALHTMRTTFPMRNCPPHLWNAAELLTRSPPYDRRRAVEKNFLSDPKPLQIANLYSIREPKWMESFLEKLDRRAKEQHAFLSYKDTFSY